MKICQKCKLALPYGNFFKNRTCKDGMDKMCKSCRKVVKTNYMATPKAKLRSRASSAAWRALNKAVITENMKKYRELNKDKIREQRKDYNSSEENKKRNYEKNKEWRKKNILHLRKIESERVKNNPQLRMRRSIRSRSNRAIKRHIKYLGTGCSLAGSAWTDKGCTNSEYISYIQSLWEPWMNWNNYGNSKDQWNIDHITPLKNFDLTKRNDFLIANHFTNTRPISAEINFKKGCKAQTEGTFTLLPS